MEESYQVMKYHGRIVKGRGFATSLDFPTINCTGVSLRPGIYKAMTQYGQAVIFACRTVTEAHVLGWSGEATDDELIIFDPRPIRLPATGGLMEVLQVGFERVRAAAPSAGGHR